MGPDIKTGDLPGGAKCFVMAGLQENCGMERVMESDTENYKKKLRQEVKGDSFGETAEKNFCDHTGI